MDLFAIKENLESADAMFGDGLTDREVVRGRWLPESELRKLLENLAALNRPPAP